MHVCLDYRPALHEGTGVGTYVRGLLRGLLQAFPDDRYTAFSASLRNRLELPPELGGATPVDARFPVRLLDWLWHRRSWPPVDRWAGAVDIAHSPSPLPMPSRGAGVITVHDCYFLRHPEHVVGPMRRDYGPLIRRATVVADAIMTVSATTREELCDLLEVDDAKVHVAHLGVEPEFRARGELSEEESIVRRERTRARFDLRRPYLLFVGRREPRKDLGTLLRAFDLVVERYPELELVLVGPEGHRWEDTWKGASRRVRDRTRVLPHQHSVTLAELYAASEALLLSSRWEGFGLTPLEAMAVGTPVAATRVGSLPEVLGNAAAWADPGNAESLASATTRLLEDAAYRNEMIGAGRRRADGYRWRRTAEATHSVYRQLGRAR
jgi:glycosyltransferase involved in cell wall biosynthesis